MPRKGGKFTPQERAFIPVMARTGDATYAAEKARLAFPVVAGSKMMQRPAVVAEIKAQQYEIVVSKLLPEATNRLWDLLTDKTQSGGTTLGAIKETRLWAYTPGDEAARKDPAQLSAIELEAEIERSKRVLAEYQERARPIVEGSTNDTDMGAFG